MKVMPGVLGQVGQSVADNLFEIGKSAVKGTAGAVADIASESIEQITMGASTQATNQLVDKAGGNSSVAFNEQRKAAERQRFDEVRAELATFIQRKQELDRKIAEENKLQSQQEKQEKYIEKKKKDSWVNILINRSQTNTEKGRMSE